MRIVGWPSNFDKEEGLSPIDLQDVDFLANPDELRALAKFLEQAADKVSQASQENKKLNIGIDFSDSKTNPQTGIWINVVHDAA